MFIRTEKTADRGCWISDDRVYAFVSPVEGTIREVGYHGLQPVSKNSRIFAGEGSAFQLFLQTQEGKQHRLSFSRCDWCPGITRLLTETPFGAVEVRCAASGKALIIDASLPGGTALLVIFDPASKLTEVHGERTWETEKPSQGWISLRVHDRILLDSWITRQGPYGGDFLIPEHIRKQIFEPLRRSGLATKEDLRPAYRDHPFPLYSAEVYIAIGGDNYTVHAREKGISFSSLVCGGDGVIAPLMIRFDDRPIIMEGTGQQHVKDLWDEQKQRESGAPQLRLADSPHIESFFHIVPGLMDSCIVRDVGVPRACPGAYYWLWAWDAMVATEASLRWTTPDLAARTAKFVQTHRGEEGVLPMQWTRGLEPLDQQQHSAMEMLLATLAYNVYFRSGSQQMGEGHFAMMLSHLDYALTAYNDQALAKNIGFYPDLPLRFGRSENSAVAMEVGSMYTFCRICENVARALGDFGDAERAASLAGKIRESFLKNFWDEEKGFLFDARDVDTGECNSSFPLFSLLFLFSPLGLPLLRPRLNVAADFIARHHLGEWGMRLLPGWDKNARSETVSSSWYPHWDRYVLKLLRRGGKVDAIMLWLRNVERVLRHLGYAPEFLQLDGLQEEDLDTWSRHGAASNLNGVTGWYVALLEGLVGLESDPGGLTLLPLALPLPETEVSALRHFGGTWNVHVRSGSSERSTLRVDGVDLQGVMKIPSRFHDHGRHDIEVTYGATWPERCFLELNNAEVIETEIFRHSVEVRVRPLGRIEVVFTAPSKEKLHANGTPCDPGVPDARGRYATELPFAPEYLLRISR